jgi:hypothetical protein
MGTRRKLQDIEVGRSERERSGCGWEYGIGKYLKDCLWGPSNLMCNG